MREEDILEAIIYIGGWVGALTHLHYYGKEGGKVHTAFFILYMIICLLSLDFPMRQGWVMDQKYF